MMQSISIPHFRTAETCIRLSIVLQFPVMEPIISKDCNTKKWQRKNSAVGLVRRGGSAKIWFLVLIRYRQGFVAIPFMLASISPISISPILSVAFTVTSILNFLPRCQPSKVILNPFGGSNPKLNIDRLTGALVQSSGTVTSSNMT
jgi:hypothetical protein